MGADPIAVYPDLTESAFKCHQNKTFIMMTFNLILQHRLTYFFNQEYRFTEKKTKILINNVKVSLDLPDFCTSRIQIIVSTIFI